ncbi:nucleoside-triphosphatase [Kitasatospora sp. NPDC004669]|uniref:nucleoside-triphosphatase n=1 Tax=Kitasatospora sp. NPDC004669 TaxID=3154555 RepID=UPI0033AD3D82
MTGPFTTRPHDAEPALPTGILPEGHPGSAKTTAVRRLAVLLRARETAGFTIEEIRTGGTRVGFALETLSGERARRPLRSSPAGR